MNTDMKKEIICISCPIGCRMVIILTDNNEITVSGNKCSRGEVYGKAEILEPRRIVTAIVKTDSPFHPYVPVKTDTPLLREHIFSLLKELYGMTVSVPIQSGDIIIRNFKKSGVNVLITRSIQNKYR